MRDALQCIGRGTHFWRHSIEVLECSISRCSKNTSHFRCRSQWSCRSNSVILSASRNLSARRGLVQSSRRDSHAKLAPSGLGKRVLARTSRALCTAYRVYRVYYVHRVHRVRRVYRDYCVRCARRACLSPGGRVSAPDALVVALGAARGERDRAERAVADQTAERRRRHRHVGEAPQALKSKGGQTKGGPSGAGLQCARVHVCAGVCGRACVSPCMQLSFSHVHRCAHVRPPTLVNHSW
eukprot:68320-Pleurochrysis_carterae.AAC.2